MTTQVLISEQEAKSLQAKSANGSTAATRPAPLPYQANHQVELLHLQAETEVLLQQLKTLKQRKISADL